MAAVDQYLPTDNDDARRQQFFARQFYLLGDYLAGSDAQPRYEPGNVGSDVLGPRQPLYQLGVGAGGEVFVRGAAGQVGTTDTTAPRLYGLPAAWSPVLLIAAAGLAFWFIARRA